MERCIYKLKCIGNSLYRLGILLLCHNCFKKFLVNILAYDFKQALLFCIFKRNKLNIVKNIIAVNRLNYNICGVRRKLSSVGTIYLIAVILFRVVACRNHNACRTSQSSYTERNLGNGMNNREKICFNSCCCKYLRCFLSKYSREISRIITD